MDSPEFGISGYNIDSNALLNWKVKARHLIASVCGEDSQHFRQFVESEKPTMYATNFETFQRMLAVFLAAKEVTKAVISTRLEI
jgi:hypothetical protein